MREKFSNHPLDPESDKPIINATNPLTLASGRDLEMDIVAETSGNLRELLLALAMGKRDNSTRVDKTLAQEDAKSVHDVRKT